VILANPITFLDSASDSSTLYIKGSNSFQLSGPITGDSTATIAMDNGPSFSASITGDNSAYAGTYAVYAGTLNINLPNNTSLQNATLDFEGPGTIGLYGAANPIIQSIKGAENNGSLGTLFINSGVTATITTTNDSNNNGPTFGGAITGGGALAVNDTSGGASGAIVLLFGNNNYTGGTTVMNDGVLAVASSTALGTGPVTVATTVHGALALDSGVTLTNSMTYTSGNLVGDGTFAPSNLPTISVGTGDAVAGGLPFAQNNIVTGTLTFGGNLAFNNGGEYYWTLQDNGRSDGVSHIDVTGNLAVNATAGQFTIKVQSYDSSGNAGGLASNFNIFAPTSWAIVTAGSITGFSAADFTINSSSFEGGAVPSANFFLTQSGNQLMLNFTPVPEPSTWALLGAGLGMLGLAVGRVRRRAAAALSAA
jgi:hypothetical protein